MDPTSRPMLPPSAWTLAIATGLAIVSLAACTPGSGLPSQAPGTSEAAAGTPDATSSTPAATSSSGGSVVPEILF